MTDSHASLVQRIQKLEEIVAYQQRTIEQLDAVLLETRSQQDELSKRTHSHKTKLDWLESNVGADHDPNEKPPHY